MMEEGAGEARVSSIEDEEREEAQKKALREQVKRLSMKEEKINRSSIFIHHLSS